MITGQHEDAVEAGQVTVVDTTGIVPTVESDGPAVHTGTMVHRLIEVTVMSGADTAEAVTEIPTMARVAVVAVMVMGTMIMQDMEMDMAKVDTGAEVMGATASMVPVGNDGHH